MKIRFLFLFILVISFVATLRVNASDPSFADNGIILNQKSATASIRGKVIVSSFSTNRNDHGSKGNGPVTLLVQSPDATINASVISVSDVILSLIAILHLQEVKEFLQPVDTPDQQDFFKILFRVIIAPNAP